MQIVARTLFIALLAVFAASSVASAASANAMSVKMAAAADGGMDMPDCQNCDGAPDGDASGPACDVMCIVPLIACAEQARTLDLGHAVALATLTGKSPPGRTSPPEPYPPRPFI